MLITTERRRFRTTADRRNRIPQRPPPFSRRRSLSRRINPDCRRLYPYNDRSTSFPPSDEFPGTRVIRTRALALLCRHNVSPPPNRLSSDGLFRVHRDVITWFVVVNAAVNLSRSLTIAFSVHVYFVRERLSFVRTRANIPNAFRKLTYL